MAFIIKSKSTVMYRSVTDNYEPCSLITTENKLMYDKDVIVDPELQKAETYSELLDRCYNDGFYVFLVTNKNFEKHKDSLLAVVHKYYVERIGK